MSKKTYIAEFTKMIEMNFSIDVEANSEEDAWEIAEKRLDEVLKSDPYSWECMGTDTTLAHITEA